MFMFALEWQNVAQANFSVIVAASWKLFRGNDPANKVSKQHSFYYAGIEGSLLFSYINVSRTQPTKELSMLNVLLATNRGPSSSFQLLEGQDVIAHAQSMILS